MNETAYLEIKTKNKFLLNILIFITPTSANRSFFMEGFFFYEPHLDLFKIQAKHFNRSLHKEMLTLDSWVKLRVYELLRIFYYFLLFPF